MSKNIYNQAPSSVKNIYNESRILAKNVKYDNSLSGLTGKNVQQAIDELVGGGGGPAVTELTTVGLSSQSILVTNPDPGPIVELKGLTGANVNAHVTVTSASNNLEFDVDTMLPNKQGVNYGYVNTGTQWLGLGFDSNPNLVGLNQIVTLGNNSFLTSNVSSGNDVIVGNSICQNITNKIDKSVLIGNNILALNGSDYNVIVGNDSLKGNTNSTIPINNNFQGNEILTNNTGIVNNNIMIGGQIYNLNKGVTGNNVDVSHNIILGSLIETGVTGSPSPGLTGPVTGNIMIGSRIQANPTESIIIHRNQSLGFTASHNNMFYLGNNTNQNTDPDEFVISNGYNTYKIFGIPASNYSRFYLNYALTNSAVDPQTIGIAPIPIDNNAVYKTLTTSIPLGTEQTFNYSLTSSLFYTMISDYGFITVSQEPNATTIPAGPWVFSIWGGVNIGLDTYILARAFKYSSAGTETLLFETAHQLLSTLVDDNVITSVQPAFAILSTDRVVIKLYVYTTSGVARNITFYLDGENRNASVFLPFALPNVYTQDLLHYDSETGDIYKAGIENTIENISKKKVLKRDTTGKTLFRVFEGATGINVTELTDILEFSLDPAYLGNTVNYRLNVDPSSNTGPLGGLIVNTASTIPGPFNIPLLDNDGGGFGIGGTIANDPNNYCTFGGDKILFNVAADYNFEIQMPILSNFIVTDCIAQLLLNGQSIFTAPPICSCFATVDIDVSTTPLSGTYAYAGLVSTSAIAHMNVGDEISLVLYLSNDEVEIPLTSSLSITICDKTGVQGPIGPTGPAGPSFSTPMAPTTLGLGYGDAIPTTQLTLGYNVYSPPTTSGINLYSSPLSLPQTEYSPGEDCIYISSASQANTLYTGSIALHLSTNLTQSMPFSVSMFTTTPVFAMPVYSSLLLATSGASFGTASGGTEKTGCLALSSGFSAGVVSVNDSSISISNTLGSHVCAASELYIGSIAKWTLAGTLPAASNVVTNQYMRRDSSTNEITVGPPCTSKATLVNTDIPVMFNTSSGLMEYNTVLARVFKFQGTTDGSGQITQSLVGLSLSAVPRITATVVNSSVIVAYTAQTNAVSTTSVTIQVFAAGVAAGAGILCDVLVAF